MTIHNEFTDSMFEEWDIFGFTALTEKLFADMYIWALGELLKEAE
jgi:hypothetical protein